MIRASVLVLLTLTACSKNVDTDAPSRSSAPSGSVVATASAAPKAAASGSAATAASSGAAYAGTYSLTPAAFYIPDTSGWNGVKQVKDDPAKDMGDGAFSLAVDPTGKVTGAIHSGPASPAVIDGQLVGDEIRGNIRRKTPSDDGLTGTIVATPAGEGKMALADANSAIVREAKLTLKKN